jgi:hypothetical protein
MGSWLPSIYSTGTGVFGEPVLDRLLPAPEDPVRLSPIFHAQSEQVLEVVRKLGLEGVVGKRIDSVHEPRRAIRCLDQAPHKHGARIRHRRLHTGHTRL